MIYLHILQGGFASVWYCTADDKFVCALKEFTVTFNNDQFLDSKEKEKRMEIVWKSFESEVEKLKQLRHENIVRLLGHKTTSDSLCIFMPLFDSSLKAQIESKQKSPNTK